MIMATSGACINSLVDFIVTLLTQPMIPSGAPASTAALFMISAAAVVPLTADGCGAKTIALRDLMAIIALTKTVEVGFVEGTIHINKPTGSATAKVCSSVFSLI